MQQKKNVRGYKYMYLSKYSPELNPIENFWSLVEEKRKEFIRKKQNNEV